MTQHTTGRLKNIAVVAQGYANDLKRGNRDERKARAILTAFVHAINAGTLDSLAQTIAPWMREQVAATDALTDGAAHDAISRAVWELNVRNEDMDELLRLDLPDAYSGIGD